MVIVWAALALILITLLLLCLPVEVRLTAHMEFPAGGPLELQIRCLFGLARLNFRFRFRLFREPVITLLWNKHSGEVRRVWDLGHTVLPKNKTGRWSKLILKSVGRHLRLRKFHITGRLGIAGDAFLTAMLSGLVTEGILAVFLGLFNERQQSAVQVGITPEFAKSRFRLNLEGIAQWFPIQIILAVFLRRIQARKGDEQSWHIPSKTL